MWIPISFLGGHRLKSWKEREADSVMKNVEWYLLAEFSAVPIGQPIWRFDPTTLGENGH